MQAPASGVSTLVVKLTNDNAEETNQANRVQNDVAAQWIARQSLASAGMASLMPNIYAWAAVATDEQTSHGWVVSEFRDGVDLDTQLPSLERAEKQAVLEQMAAILARIQQAELPKGANMFAGLAFDHDGTIMSGQAPQHMGDGKPLETYADRRMSMLRSSLDAASDSTIIEGWKENGVKDRIETFLNEGGPAKVLEGIDLRQKGIIHGDFCKSASQRPVLLRNPANILQLRTICSSIRKPRKSWQFWTSTGPTCHTQSTSSPSACRMLAATLTRRRAR